MLLGSISSSKAPNGQRWELDPLLGIAISMKRCWMILGRLWEYVPRPKTKHKLDIRSGEDYKKLYEHEQK